MKNQFILIFLLTLMGSLVVNGQSPTATPGTPFNPFQPPNRDYPTPTPTVSRKALSQVPSQTQGAKTNRNSSTVNWSPTPPPNNRTMPSGNSAPGSNGGITFGNGAQLVRQGDQIIITHGGRRYLMSRKDAKPPPAGTNLNCRQVKRMLDRARTVDDNWRYMSVWWADHCL